MQIWRAREAKDYRMKEACAHTYRRELVLASRIQRASTGAAGHIVLSKREVVGYSVQRTLDHHAFAADDALRKRLDGGLKRGKAADYVPRL